ncbi:hypothetical protein POUND7_011769 [Theobroma cacao]
MKTDNPSSTRFVADAPSGSALQQTDEARAKPRTTKPRKKLAPLNLGVDKIPPLVQLKPSEADSETLVSTY